MVSAGYMIRATYLAVRRTIHKRFDAYRMTSPQWYFMREIWMQEGLSQRELSERVGTAESTTVSALRVLERRKLIYRESKPLDRRSSRVYLTEAGRKLRDELVPIIDHTNEIAVAGLSAEQINALEQTLTHIRSNLLQYLEHFEAQPAAARKAKTPRKVARAASKAPARKGLTAKAAPAKSPAKTNGSRRMA